MKSFLERICFTPGVNTIFLKYLGVEMNTNIIQKIRCINKNLCHKLPLEITCLNIQQYSDFEALKYTVFPKVQKLSLFLGVTQGCTFYTNLLISKKQFPYLKELSLYIAYTASHAIIIDNDITLTKIQIGGGFVDSVVWHFPLNSLRQISLHSNAFKGLLYTVLTKLLEDSTTPLLEKLQVSIMNRCLFDMLSAVMYKFCRTLRHICIKNKSDFEFPVDSIVHLDKGSFVQLELFEYYSKTKSGFYIFDTDAITEFSFRDQLLRYVHCPQKPIFNNLKRINLKGTIEEIVTFLQNLNQSLAICAPNGEVLQVTIETNPIHSHENTTEQLNFNPFPCSILNLCLIDSFLNSQPCHHGLYSWTVLRDIRIDSSVIFSKLHLYQLPFLTKCCISYSKQKQDESQNGQVIIQDCRALKKIFLNNVPKTILHNLSCLQKLEYRSERSCSKINFGHINTVQLRKLKIDVREQYILKHIIKLLSHSNHLETLEICLELTSHKEASLFLKSVLSQEYKQLKTIELITNNGDLDLQNLSTLKNFSLKCQSHQSQQIYVTNCELLTNLTIQGFTVVNKSRIDLSNLPQLQILDINLQSSSSSSIFETLSLFAYKLPMCSNVTLSPCVTLFLKTGCSEMLNTIFIRQENCVKFY